MLKTIALIIAVLVAFYLLVDSEGLVTVFVRLFPREKRKQVDGACPGRSTLLEKTCGSGSRIGRPKHVLRHWSPPVLIATQTVVTTIASCLLDEPIDTAERDG